MKWDPILGKRFKCFHLDYAQSFVKSAAFSRESFQPRLFLAAATFFFWWCYSYGPQQGPDRQQKKRGGLKQRRKQEEAAQGDPEPGKGNQEKEKDPSRVNGGGEWLFQSSNWGWLGALKQHHQPPAGRATIPTATMLFTTTGLSRPPLWCKKGRSV